MIRNRWSPRVLLALLAFAVTSRPAAAAPDPVADAIAVRVAAATSSAGLVVGGDRISSVRLLPEFYRAREFRQAWRDARNVDVLLAAIRDAGSHGLAPADYHVAAVERLRPAATARDAAPAARADFDLLLTDALIRLAYHLQIGKVDAQTLDPHWNGARTIAGDEAVARMSRALDGSGLAAAIAALAPSEPYYETLRRVLAEYRRLADAGGWAPIPAGATLKPGDRAARVPLLRRRLAATRDVTGGVPADSLRFDEALAAGVRRFQYRAFLEPDGIVGAGTLRALNVPAARRADQVRVDLERARWVMHELPERYVLVNVSSSNVYLLERGKIAWRARAQVGQVARKTPIFRSEITYLVFNPTWTVPPGILRRDILPAGRRGEPVLQRKQLKAIDAKGREVPPSQVRWSASPFPYTLRQDPGPDNALGRVKFMFPNEHAVYLHDTPSKDLFDQDRRAFSSGCIRIERPFELAQRLLDDPAQWSPQAIAGVVATGKLRNVTLREPVPVLLLYWTVSVDDAGLVRFSDDVYARDAAVRSALDAPFRFRRKPALATSRP